MKTLLLLRHAKSSWSDASLDDHDRPLNKRGKRDAPRMGQLLRELRCTPELVLSSTAKRARKTAEEVIQSSGLDITLRLLPQLYHADSVTFVATIRREAGAAECLMVVGHNPGMEDFLMQLTRHDEMMPTAALAEISLPIDAWQDLALDTAGALRNLWRPKELES
jgi:phosphohistidine phosphatase